MTEHKPDHTPHTTLPAFAPVPRAKDRHNGWKPAVQRAFIEALAETGSVKSAARRVARAEVGAYLLRRHPGAQEFRAAWDAALDIGMRRIEDVAMDRALHGVEVPVYSYGKLVGSRTVYNDRLVMFMLRNRAPDRFAGGKAKAINATDKDTLARLKKQWREEWAREHTLIEDEREQNEGDDFIATIKAMHRGWYLDMSPTTRAAYRAFRAAEDADDGAWMIEEDAEAMNAVEAEYEEWFGEGHDRRAPVAKLVDMRAWPREGDEEEENPQ
ncbi:MAG: hypothetical protein Q8R44_13905 [Novosphingobium sp.]|nr:hypothetical protein [Novosphingobium sp.]